MTPNMSTLAALVGAGLETSSDFHVLRNPEAPEPSEYLLHEDTTLGPKKWPKSNATKKSRAKKKKAHTQRMKNKKR